ncbi:LysR family transcriptional regulator [Nocardia sp. NPDC127526]|uniref:LysR family transcriptional regulator n=1 Tax=Nocardia sp. NPDC127526 TaxID=3345393 RepID=UPI00362E861C
MLERHEIEVFLTLVEELHFGRTAEQLHLSTARVSQTVTKLERRLGVPLFDRSSRRVSATAAACALYADIRPAWDRIGAAVRHTIDTGRGRGGTLTVAFTDVATSQLLTRAAEYFNAELPDCTVRIREAPPAQVISWLRDGEIDMAFDAVPVTEPDISTGAVLVEEARMLAVPANHRLAQRRSIAPGDLTGIAVLRPGPEAATYNELLTLVGAGRGVTPMPAHAQRYYARPDIAYIPFRGGPPVQWALLWLSAAESARIREFAHAATRAAA